MEVGGIEPHTRVVAQELTPYCDQIMTVFNRQFAINESRFNTRIGARRTDSGKMLLTRANSGSI